MRPLEGSEQSSDITGLLSEQDKAAGRPSGSREPAQRRSNNTNENDGDVDQDDSRDRVRGLRFSRVVKRTQRDLGMDSMSLLEREKRMGLQGFRPEQLVGQWGSLGLWLWGVTRSSALDVLSLR